MSKRPYDDRPHSGYDNKKPRFSSIDQSRHYDRSPAKYVGPKELKADLDRKAAVERSNYSIDHAAAERQLPSNPAIQAAVPAFTPFTVPKSLPPLPEITNPGLVNAPYTHKSLHNYDRASSTSDVTYERLEFLGDAYLELIASRLIFHHFPSLPAGSQSQVRELLVKNETLAEYARLYGFEKRVQVADIEQVNADAAGRGNKGLNKILGDVLEAYIAAVVLSDAENGFATVEKWLTALWAPKLMDAARTHKLYTPDLSLQHGASPKPADLLKIYDPTAKATLQQRIQGHNIKIEYKAWKPMVELKGDQLGQNRHFIAVYVTGYGLDKECLGKGEGRNKVEAGNWAATEAMYGECKGIVEEWEKKRNAEREAKAVKDAQARDTKMKGAEAMGGLVRTLRGEEA